MENIHQFRDILIDLRRIKQEQDLANLDDNMLFDGAVRIYNSLIINSMKPRMNGNKKKVVAPSPMTERQRALLRDLDYRGNMHLTKQEATGVIQERLDRAREARAAAR